jgi:ribonuclease VapC
VIIDASALIAILRAESDVQIYARAIENAETRRISAANFLEVAVVMDGSRDPIISRRLDQLISEADITIEPITGRQAHLARTAYRDFGKSCKHRAKLNFGDCFAYALAKHKHESTLFKGSDLSYTDIESAVE